jgi:Asp-tRNA(Asn)/Glu-tRNA(Gln) amidotransferase A subunit family amidase
MKNVKVKKSEALEILKKNREDHRKIFLEALEGYKKQAVELLEKHIKGIKAGRVASVRVQIPEPQDYTREYDRAIKMLEMSVDDIVELDEDTFAQFVMDDWDWKRQFLSSNAPYSASATAAAQSLRDED